jgi:hypothetical protein
MTAKRARSSSEARFDGFLTIDPGTVYRSRARLAPEMISTPGNRDPRRRQRGALPAWCYSEAGSSGHVMTRAMCYS